MNRLFDGAARSRDAPLLGRSVGVALGCSAQPVERGVGKFLCDVCQSVAEFTGH